MRPCAARSRSLLALAIVLSGACGQTAAAPDAKLLDAATKAQPAVIESLKDMVAIETGSADLDGLAKMATWLDQRLTAMGFKTERRKASAGPGADIVIGTMAGTGKKKVMLQGHMDTVYERGILQTQAYRLDGNRLYGPGIADDKGGLAVILHALKILADAGWKDYATLTVLVNPDEEIGSIGSGEVISALADQHDTVLSFEPTAAKAVVKGEALLLGAAGTAAGDDGGEGPRCACRCGPRPGPQRHHRDLAPDDPDQGRGQGHSRCPAQLDQCDLEQGDQSDS